MGPWTVGAIRSRLRRQCVRDAPIRTNESFLQGAPTNRTRVGAAIRAVEVAGREVEPNRFPAEDGIMVNARLIQAGAEVDRGGRDDDVELLFLQEMEHRAEALDELHTHALEVGRSPEPTRIGPENDLQTGGARREPVGTSVLRANPTARQYERAGGEGYFPLDPLATELDRGGPSGSHGAREC